MANRTDDIVDQIAGAESAVTALVGNHPHSKKNTALAHPIGSVSDVRTKHEKAGID